MQQSLITHWSVENDDPLGQMCQYALFPPGKMIRPLLILDGCAMVGGLPQSIMPAAAGAEYAHVASLIHDDIIDHDDIRRGRDTLYRCYGTEYALLAGDLLVFQSFLALARCIEGQIPAERIVRAVQIVASVGIDMCRGQALEAQVARDLACDMSTYFQIIRLKTASLFRGALESGAVLGGGHEEQIAKLGEYGEQLGILFQIIDDLLCYTDTEALGKSKLSDLKNKRLTLPVIYAYQTGGSEAQRRIERIFHDGHNGNCDKRYAELLCILEQTGAITKSRASADKYAKAAMAALQEFPESISRRRLESYIHHLCLTRRM